jgi:hypothetical protein
MPPPTTGSGWTETGSKPALQVQFVKRMALGGNVEAQDAIQPA